MFISSKTPSPFKSVFKGEFYPCVPNIFIMGFGENLNLDNCFLFFGKLLGNGLS